MDKLRRTAPLVISFLTGESPTSNKLTALNNQFRAAFNVVEKAVGDVWSQSGDSLLFTFPLQIPNLARALGEQKYLNPCLYPVDEDFVYVDNVGAKYLDQNELYLQFKPKTLTGMTAAGGGSLDTDPKANYYDVVATGNWWVDVNTGKFRSFDELVADDEITYTVDSTEWNVKTTTLPGIIPDPRQVDFTGCRISTAGGKFYIHLPPRIRLSADFDLSTFDGWSLPERYPPSVDHSDNYDTTVAAVGSKKLWQDPVITPTSIALEDAFYRYSLPKEMKDQLATLNTGDSLPVGFLYLWNRDTGTIVADAVFKKSALGNWIFEITSATVDFSSLVSGSEAETNYNSTLYSVIAVGSPVSRSLWTLSNAFMNHEHNNKGDFSSLMDHGGLINLNPPPSDYSGHSSKYPTTVPAWRPSRWASDDHVSLLSRAGSQNSATTERDENDNAMLGDLVMGSSTESGGNYLNVSADSRKIYFGSVAAGPSIYGLSGGNIRIEGTIAGATGNDNGLTCIGIGDGFGIAATGSGSGTGVRGEGGITGTGVVGNGGATSGPGVTGTANAGNDNGVEGTGHGSGASIYAVSGPVEADSYRWKDDVSKTSQKIVISPSSIKPRDPDQVDFLNQGDKFTIPDGGAVAYVALSLPRYSTLQQVDAYVDTTGRTGNDFAIFVYKALWNTTAAPTELGSDIKSDASAGTMTVSSLSEAVADDRHYYVAFQNTTDTDVEVYGLEITVDFLRPPLDGYTG